MQGDKFGLGEFGMNGGKRQNHPAMETAIAWRTDLDAVAGAARTHSLEIKRRGIAATLAQEFAAAWAACGTFEWIALGYLGLSIVLITWFAENLAHPVRLIGVQLLVSLLVLALS